MSAINLLLVDDHAVFRTGLGMILRSGFTEVSVHEAASLEEAIVSSIDVPDALLLDIKLQGLNGLEGISLLRRKWPDTLIIMLSSDTAPETIRLALERGAAAYISKADSAENILGTIREVLCGNFASVGGKAAGCHKRSLTPRQCEVLVMMSQGLSNKAIGTRLGLSENTVRGHVQGVLGYLQVTSRSEAVFAARQRGLIG